MISLQVSKKQEICGKRGMKMRIKSIILKMLNYSSLKVNLMSKQSNCNRSKIGLLR